MELTELIKVLPEFANPYVMKCILLGKHGSGKTTLANVLSTGVFDQSISPTIGMDFASLLLKIDQQQIRVQIWDSAGQERFRNSIVATYLRDVHIAFVVFDLSCRQSWEDIVHWKELLDKQELKIYPRLVLVGTKSDIYPHQVHIEEIQRVAKEWKCNHYVLSSKQTNSRHIIHRMFLLEVEQLHHTFIKLYSENKKLPSNILLNKKLALPEKVSNCCFQ